MYSIISGTLATQATSIIGGIDKIGGNKNYPFHCMYSIISGTLAGFVFSLSAVFTLKIKTTILH
jgi:hypothetical protein